MSRDPLHRRVIARVPVLPVLRVPWVPLTVMALSCQPTPQGPHRQPPPEIPDARATTDGGQSPGLCALRSAPPEDISLGPGRSPPVLAWNGTYYGIAWVEDRDGEPAVMFVRVGEDGSRQGTAVRVSERGFRAAAPSLAWNGASWSLLFEGGVGSLGDLYQARVDARGIAVGRPWRITRGAREDYQPTLASAGRGYGLAWVSRQVDGRWSLYAAALPRWDAAEVPPTQLLNTSVTLASPRMVWTGHAWAATVLTAGREVLAVDLARMEPDGTPRGTVTRASSDRLGGVDTVGRYAVAWDGTAFGVAWSELRDGLPQVLLRRVGAHGETVTHEVSVSQEAQGAGWPAVERVGDGVLAVAMQVDREGNPRVWIRTVDALGVRPGHIEIQDTNGGAATPALAWTGRALGVATATSRGVNFHRVTVGPCVP